MDGSPSIMMGIETGSGGSIYPAVVFSSGMICSVSVLIMTDTELFVIWNN